MADDDDRKSGVTRILGLLGEVARAEQPMSLAAMVEAVRLPKATVHRLCRKLEDEGYLIREPDGRLYGVGPRLEQLGWDAIRTSRRSERHAVLQRLVAIANETCNLVVKAGLDALYIDRVEAQWPLRLHLEIGSRVPLHSTASGKIFLAAMPAAQRRRTLLALAAEQPFDLAALEAECQTILKRDYSLDDQEFLAGLVAIAVPVRDAEGTIIAALACHGPIPRFGVERAAALLPELQSAAIEIGALSRQSATPAR